MYCEVSAVGWSFRVGTVPQTVWQDCYGEETGLRRGNCLRSFEAADEDVGVVIPRMAAGHLSLSILNSIRKIFQSELLKPKAAEAGFWQEVVCQRAQPAR